jgi:membrane protein
MRKGTAWRKVLSDTLALWQAHRGARVAAALSFYAIFSIAPLFFVVIVLARSLLGRSDALATIDAELAPLLGSAGINGINTLVAASQHSIAKIPLFIGVAVVLFSIFAIFMQVQEALDDLWEIPEHKRGGVLEIVALRLHVVLVILALGILAIVTLVGAALGGRVVASAANVLAIVAFLTVAYRVLPRREVGWKSSAIGAVITAAILVLGEAGLSLYFARFHPEREYGTAGSVIVLLIWIYYSALLFLFGAALTRALEGQTKNGIAHN